jgi:hypothetical protein
MHTCNIEENAALEAINLVDFYDNQTLTFDQLVSGDVAVCVVCDRMTKFYGQCSTCNAITCTQCTPTCCAAMVLS